MLWPFKRGMDEDYWTWGEIPTQETRRHPGFKSAPIRPGAAISFRSHELQPRISER